MSNRLGGFSTGLDPATRRAFNYLRGLLGVGGWTTFTPAWTGIVLDGSEPYNTGQYRYVPGGMYFNVALQAGSGTTFVGSPQFILDIPDGALASTLSGARWLLDGYFYDASADEVYGGNAHNGNSTTQFYLVGFNGDRGSGVPAVGPTSPFTWAENDVLRLAGFVGLE